MRGGGVRRRRVVFIGVEGKSDRAFVRFLGHICDDERLHLHLDVKPSGGGDSLAWGIEVVLINPNLEGLLVRLHEGHETRGISASDAARALRKLWPEYKKGLLTAKQLKRRFDLKDVRRAARHDEALRKLLEALGL